MVTRKDDTSGMRQERLTSWRNPGNGLAHLDFRNADRSGGRNDRLPGVDSDLLGGDHGGALLDPYP